MRLERLRLNYRLGTLVIFLTFHPSFVGHAYGQFQQEQTQIPLNITLTVYHCMNPEREPPCSCWKEEDKTTACPGCQEWKRETITDDRVLTLDTLAYTYATGAPRANYFVQDISEELYEIDFPTTNAGFPITTSSFYRNYAKFGWSEVPPQGDKTGSIAIWRGHAGLVIEEDNDTVKILYPSHKFRGELLEGNAVYVMSTSEPRYVVPNEFMQELVLESLSSEAVSEEPPFP